VEVFDFRSGSKNAGIVGQITQGIKEEFESITETDPQVKSH